MEIYEGRLEFRKESFRNKEGEQVEYDALYFVPADPDVSAEPLRKGQFNRSWRLRTGPAAVEVSNEGTMLQPRTVMTIVSLGASGE